MSVRLEKEGGVGIIVLDRPPANSYDYAFLRSFAGAIDDARLDLSIKSAVVVTSASEKFFSAGADVGVFAAGSPRSRFMTALIANATTLKPAEAKDLGIVDRLFPDAAACRAGAIEYAAKLAAGAGVAIGHAKLAITQGYGGPLDLGLAIEREAIGRVFVSDDAEEGIKAFTEKRKPDFKSR